MAWLRRTATYPLRTVAVRLTIIRAKTYKKQLKDHNCRKNIRSTPSDAEAYQNMFWSRQLPAHVRLTNGQVVARDHLAAHLKRKINHAQTPAMIRAPDKYYFIESAYTHTRQYLVSSTLTPVITLGFTDLIAFKVWPFPTSRHSSRCSYGFRRVRSIYTEVGQFRSETRRCA